MFYKKKVYKMFVQIYLYKISYIFSDQKFCRNILKENFIDILL